MPLAWVFVCAWVCACVFAFPHLLRLQVSLKQEPDGSVHQLILFLGEHTKRVLLTQMSTGLCSVIKTHEIWQQGVANISNHWNNELPKLDLFGKAMSQIKISHSPCQWGLTTATNAYMNIHVTGVWHVTLVWTTDGLWVLISCTRS